jgi:hypothetical protein
MTAKANKADLNPRKAPTFQSALGALTPNHPGYKNELLNERHTTHGDFLSTASLSQQVKMIWRESLGWNRLTVDQRETLDMIAQKAARILSGDPNFKDHWDDIGGYSNLISERLK